ncbi:MAG: hypothetical protein JSV84_12985 [Gemmatimonadota bacterium]|nr:MAG: hypothetical protein JSV84_12985 [Gemmatimonadota bacterium]
MSETINWTLNVQVVGGPKISTSQTITVDAYDKIEVVIPQDAENEDIEIQPGGPGQVQFLLIRSDQYDDNLTYKVNVDTATPIKLDAQQLLMGDGAVGLLSEEAPGKLLFSNAMGADASIEILVGRKATT